MQIKHVLILFVICVAAFTAAFILSCAEGGDVTGKASLKLLLVDAPVDDADNVFITVESLSVKGDKWIDLEITPTEYDLLELQNNAFAVLADEELPAGDYTELRLIIGCEGETAPTIVIDGQTQSLTVPSGCTSGLKVKGDFTIGGGEETVMILDFDVRKSIHETDGGYNMNPVLRLVAQLESGTISGTISPAQARVPVYAFEAGTFADDNFDEATNSTLTSGTGAFAITALPAGTYDLVLDPEGYFSGVYFEGVVVTGGEEVSFNNAIELLPETE